MGRQAYLTKIALGRSAFEPSQTVTQSSEYIQLASSQSELPPESRCANASKYPQLYDERGNPINPRAHEHGRRLREAQNDVLASIGVVERCFSPSHDLSGSYEDRLESLEVEDTAGNAVGITSIISKTVCTWWIGSLRARILTFRFQHALPFTQIVASERLRSGKAITYSGFLSDQLHGLGREILFCGAVILRPVERLLALQGSGKQRRLYREWRTVTRITLWLSIECLLYPFVYHSHLQRLGLVPASPLLPLARAFIPFSQWSLSKPFSLHYDASASAVDVLKVIVTSPFVFVCLEHFVERWVYAAVSHAIESAVIHPDNPDIISPAVGRLNRRATFLRLQMQPPSLVRNTINKLLVTIGWGEPVDPAKRSNKEPHSVQEHEIGDGQTIEFDDRQVTNLNRLDIPLAHQEASTAVRTQEEDGLVVPVMMLSEVLPMSTSSSPPPSPMASQASQNDNDPRIRITSREGIVEMEVRFPRQVVSSHSEIVGSSPSTPTNHHSPSPHPLNTAGRQAYHRVTQLSLRPANMLSEICKTQVVNWVTLPLKLVTLRLIAAHYLASGHGSVGHRRVLLDPLPALSDFTWSSGGVQASRIALCGALELAFDLSIWGGQYMAVYWMGTNAFNWGRL